MTIDELKKNAKVLEEYELFKKCYNALLRKGTKEGYFRSNHYGLSYQDMCYIIADKLRDAEETIRRL